MKTLIVKKKILRAFHLFSTLLTALTKFPGTITRQRTRNEGVSGRKGRRNRVTEGNSIFPRLVRQRVASCAVPTVPHKSVAYVARLFPTYNIKSSDNTENNEYGARIKVKNKKKYRLKLNKFIGEFNQRQISLLTKSRSSTCLDFFYFPSPQKV